MVKDEENEWILLLWYLDGVGFNNMGNVTFIVMSKFVQKAKCCGKFSVLFALWNVCKNNLSDHINSDRIADLALCLKVNNLHTI